MNVIFYYRGGGKKHTPILRLENKNRILFMTKMAKIDTLNSWPSPLGFAHSFIDHIRKYPPGLYFTVCLFLCFSVILLTSEALQE